MRGVIASSSFKTFLHLMVFTFGFFLSSNLMAQDGATCNFDQFGAALAGRESNGNYAAVNTYGYLGKYQFGTGALTEIGFYNGPVSGTTQNWNGPWSGAAAEKYNVHSMSDFLSNQAAQDYAFQQNQAVSWRQIQSKGLDQYVGQTINGVKITQSGLLAGCHLKGCGGLNKCLSTGASCTDGYNTSVFEYMQKFGGYNTPFGGDGSCAPITTDTAMPRSSSFGNPQCSETIRLDIETQVKVGVAKRNDLYSSSLPPPKSLSQVINTPCKSSELQRISNKFAYAPSKYAGQIQYILNGVAGPAAGIMNKMFKADFQKFMDLANFSSVGKAFQDYANGQLGGLLDGLGLGDSPFNDALCGLMVDTVLKYVQCEAPVLNLPNLGSLDWSLNDLLPNNCAGNAVRGSLYQAAGKRALFPSNQPVQGGAGTFYKPGNALTLGAEAAR